MLSVTIQLYAHANIGTKSLHKPNCYRWSQKINKLCLLLNCFPLYCSAVQLSVIFKCLLLYSTFSIEISILDVAQEIEFFSLKPIFCNRHRSNHGLPQLCSALQDNQQNYHEGSLFAESWMCHCC